MRLLSLDRVVKRESEEKLADRAGWRPSPPMLSAIICPVGEHVMERDGVEGRLQKGVWRLHEERGGGYSRIRWRRKRV